MNPTVNHRIPHPNIVITIILPITYYDTDQLIRERRRGMIGIKLYVDYRYNYSIIMIKLNPRVIWIIHMMSHHHIQ